jgi:hypothetical protein
MLKNKRVIPGAETGQPTFQFVRCLLVDLAAESFETTSGAALRADLTARLKSAIARHNSTGPRVVATPLQGES